MNQRPAGVEGSSREQLSAWAKSAPYPESLSEPLLATFAKAEKSAADEEVDMRKKGLTGPDDGPPREAEDFFREALAEQLNALDWGISNLEVPRKESQTKIQLSIPNGVRVLLKAWAVAESRDFSGVALQALEVGMRSLQSNGSIPTAAINCYERYCQERLAVAEANAVTSDLFVF